MADAPFPAATAAALSEALRLDATLAAEPDRLRRALADLAPFDERGGWLLALGAAVGLPGLLGQGLAAEAHARLADLGSCRPAAAAWAVSAWAAALGAEPPAEDGDAGVPAAGPAVDRAAGPFAGPAADPFAGAGTDPFAGPGGSTAAPAEEPGQPTALRVALWPDGGPVLAAVTMRGVFALDGVQEPASGRWRRVATVTAPLSRDVALALDAAPGQVVWTSAAGVHARTLRGTGGLLSLGDPRLLAAPPAGEQARYPLAAAGDQDGGLHTLWTWDRQRLAQAEERVWGGPATLPAIPGPDAEAGRLAGLDWCLDSGRAGWLLARTDRGRLLAARWDLTVNEAGRWLDLEPPAAPAAAALACLGGTLFAVVVTQSGELLSADVPAVASGRAGWHSIDRPGQVRAAPPSRVLAAGGRPDRPDLPGWLAVAGSGGMWAMPLSRSGDILACGVPCYVWTGQ